MGFAFDWNELADQPHNVAPRDERMKHHLRRADGYITLFAWNLWKIGPIYLRYRRLRRVMHLRHSTIDQAFACAVSPVEGREQDIIDLLAETGVRQTLVRVPSWDKDAPARVEEFALRLRQAGFEIVVALLQNRDDVRDPGRWRGFLSECFGRLTPLAAAFEVGHAWNRTKWGVWDYREYLDLAAPAFGLAPEYDAKLVGPAVIDFEFHLYPPTLSVLPFDVHSSLLYVDRVGAPENGQAGLSAADKVALLKSVIEHSTRRRAPLWITEVNWPLAGTGAYSPASGKPNVSEEDQADFLVRYHVLCLAGGYVDRIYWWQLIAPGYGLVDSRGESLRRRPAFAAYKTMVGRLEGAEFLGRDDSPWAEVFRFRRGAESLAVCWTAGPARDFRFDQPVERVVDRDGRDVPPAQILRIEGSPLYVHFRTPSAP